MKQTPPPPEVRIILTNLISTLNFTPQTHHNAISILMHPNLPQLANHDVDICIAALFLSQKFHETHPLSIIELCNRTGVHQSTILAMELMIFRAIGFRLFATGLLVDECLAVAYEWDRFVARITCINVRFYGDQPNVEGQFCTKICPLSAYAYRILLESVEKLAYKLETSNYNRLNISLAIVSLCIKQAERYQSKTTNSINIGSNCSTINRKMLKMGRIEHKSTDFIIQDFMQSVYGIGYEDIKDELIFTRGVISGLRDITTTFRSIHNITNRNQLQKSQRRP